MKISPVTTGGVPSINPNEGSSASPSRMARAKAVATGQSPDGVQEQSQDSQVQRAQESIKRIKLRTQMSPDRHKRLEALTTEQSPIESVPKESNNEATPELATSESDTLASSEQTPVALEETKPLSPQFAALAKQKREIQLELKKLEAEKASLSASKAQDLSGYVSKEEIKANALKVLLEQGVTYDQLTEQILANNQENPDLFALKAEIKALKEGLDNQNKSISEKDAATENQVFTHMETEAQKLISQGDEFEAIREGGYLPEVMRLIKTDWQKNQYVWDVADACREVENGLIEEALKWNKIKKVQSRLNPAPQEAQTRTVQPDRPNTKVMRTLTNRDGASSMAMSKRERAIAAMEGRLKS